MTPVLLASAEGQSLSQERQYPLLWNHLSERTRETWSWLVYPAQRKHHIENIWLAFKGQPGTEFGRRQRIPIIGDAQLYTNRRVATPANQKSTHNGPLNQGGNRECEGNRFQPSQLNYPMMPHALALAVEILTTVLAVAGIVYFLQAMVAARVFLAIRRRKLPDFAPAVSILKSLKGRDPR